MEGKPKLEVLTTPSQFDGVRPQIENTIVKNRDFFNFKMTEIPHMNVAVDSLKKGTADLLAMSIEQWKTLDNKGLQISAFLPRREPTWVLVADDKPEYLPYRGKIVCENELITRQLLRMRPDLEVVTLAAFLQGGPDEIGEGIIEQDEELLLLEKLHVDGSIDGYAIPRGKFGQIKSRVRRHTLGMQREKPSQEFERSTFIPPPLQGFTVLVSRSDFPKKVIARLNDSATELCYEIENHIFESLNDKIKHVCGLFVEQKKLSTILKHYVKLIDDSYALRIGENYLIPSDKKSRDSRTKWSPSRNVAQGPRICIYFEVLGKNSDVSFEMVRIEPISGNSLDRAKNVFIKEIKFLVDLLQRDHDELNRLISGLPPEYQAAKPGLLKL